MRAGKPAGIPCVQLLPDLRCALFGKSERPAVCVSLRPTNEMCGASREEALAGLTALELATRPSESKVRGWGGTAGPAVYEDRLQGGRDGTNGTG
jgi:uncharacterized protein